MYANNIFNTWHSSQSVVIILQFGVATRYMFLMYECITYLQYYVNTPPKYWNLIK
jgi:hypothetical protein